MQSKVYQVVSLREWQTSHLIQADSFDAGIDLKKFQWTMNFMSRKTHVRQIGHEAFHTFLCGS